MKTPKKILSRVDMEAGPCHHAFVVVLDGWSLWGCCAATTECTFHNKNALPTKHIREILREKVFDRDVEGCDKSCLNRG